MPVEVKQPRNQKQWLLSNHCGLLANHREAEYFVNDMNSHFTLECFGSKRIEYNR